MAAMSPATFHDNPSSHRFEAVVDGNVAAYAEYNVLKNGLLFTHLDYAAIAYRP